MSQVNRSDIRSWVFRLPAIVFAGLSVGFVFGATKSMIHAPNISERTESMRTLIWPATASYGGGECGRRNMRRLRPRMHPDKGCSGTCHRAELLGAGPLFVNLFFSSVPDLERKSEFGGCRNGAARV